MQVYIHTYPECSSLFEIVLLSSLAGCGELCISRGRGFSVAHLPAPSLWALGKWQGGLSAAFSTEPNTTHVAPQRSIGGEGELAVTCEAQVKNGLQAQEVRALVADHVPPTRETSCLFLVSMLGFLMNRSSKLQLHRHFIQTQIEPF
jgi:hypothetical protein